VVCVLNSHCRASCHAAARTYVARERTVRKGIICYHCGKMGHMKRECKKVLAEQAKEACVQWANQWAQTP
jgi:hypothetical protein